MLNFKTDVNRVEWLNLVFENRNQSYGAYQLRKESGNYLMKALMISGILFSSAIVVSSISNHLTKVDVVNPVISDPITPDIIPIDVVEQPIIPQKQDAGGAKQEIKSTDNLQQVNLSGNIRPSHADVATEIPTIVDIDQSVITNIDQTGVLGNPGTNTLSPGGIADGTGTGLTEGNGKEIVGTELLEVMPQFPGGMEAWAKFLSRNLRYPLMAQENNVMGRVSVSFVVEKNGEITNLKVIKGIGAGCDEEAMRVIKKSPFWKPGIQNGRAVRVAYIMPIVFRME